MIWFAVRSLYSTRCHRFEKFWIAVGDHHVENPPSSTKICKIMRCHRCNTFIDVSVEINDRTAGLYTRINALRSKNDTLKTEVRVLSEQLNQATMTVEKLQVCDFFIDFRVKRFLHNSDRRGGGENAVSPANRCYSGGSCGETWAYDCGCDCRG